MRSSLPVSILSLLLPTLAASAATPQCLNSKARGLAGQAVCGDKETLLKCFQKSSEASEGVIEECLTKAGCTPKAAASEASYLISFCEGEPSDLKKREREGTSQYIVEFAQQQKHCTIERCCFLQMSHGSGIGAYPSIHLRTPTALCRSPPILMMAHYNLG